MQYLKDDMYPQRAQGSNTIEEFILGVQGLLYLLRGRLVRQDVVG